MCVSFCLVAKVHYHLLIVAQPFSLIPAQTYCIQPFSYPECRVSFWLMWYLGNVSGTVIDRACLSIFWLLNHNIELLFSDSWITLIFCLQTNVDHSVFIKLKWYITCFKTGYRFGLTPIAILHGLSLGIYFFACPFWEIHTCMHTSRAAERRVS